jgi:hypothetical protein
MMASKITLFVQDYKTQMILKLGDYYSLGGTYRAAAIHNKETRGTNYDDFTASDSNYIFLKNGELKFLSVVPEGIKIEAVEQLTDEQEAMGQDRLGSQEIGH